MIRDIPIPRDCTVISSEGPINILQWRQRVVSSRDVMHHVFLFVCFPGGYSTLSWVRMRPEVSTTTL